jgi:hypothetical protein
MVVHGQVKEIRNFYCNQIGYIGEVKLLVV